MKSHPLRRLKTGVSKHMKLAIRILATLLGLVLLAVVMGLLAGYFNEKIEPGSVAPPMPSAEGNTIEINLVEQPVIEQATGTIRAKNETAISSRIMATILSLTVRAGDSVEKGEVLVTLDDRDLVSRVDQAKQSLESVEAKLRDAELELQRTRELVENGAAPRAQLDSVRANYEGLVADRERAQNAVEEAQANLSYATIKSPIDGRVIERYAEPGDTASPGQAIVRLYDPASLRLEADVRESLAAQFARGKKLRVRIDAIGEEFDAIVDEIVPQSQAGSRSFIVKAALPEHANLYPGMFGRLLIPRGMEEKIYIPASSLARVGQLDYVIVKSEQGIARRFVRAGERGKDEGRVEILSGLEPGEVILETNPPTNQAKRPESSS